MSSSRRLRPKRRIAVITGSRAEYGLLKSTMEAIDRRATLELHTIATGMHLLRKFGHTVDEMVEDGWNVDAKIRMQRGTDDPTDQATGLARGVAGIAKYLARARIDIVLVLGDRIEAMAGALAAVTTGRFLAHIHGGDVAPGDFDDSLRAAITKLAHVHLTATSSASRRVSRMGETPDRIHCVGAPGLDDLTRLARRKNAVKLRTKHALILHHPRGRKAETERRTMVHILRTVAEAGLDRTVIYPNSDRGHSGIIGAIVDHKRACANGELLVHRSMNRCQYLKQLIAADLIVGNSSSGIIEAATAGTIAINVGPRQDGRQRSGRWVIDASETKSDIAAAIKTALRYKRPITPSATAYGDGQAGTRIAKVLAQVPLSDAFRRKTFTS